MADKIKTEYPDPTAGLADYLAAEKASNAPTSEQMIREAAADEPKPVTQPQTIPDFGMATGLADYLLAQSKKIVNPNIPSLQAPTTTSPEPGKWPSPDMDYVRDKTVAEIGRDPWAELQESSGATTASDPANRQKLIQGIVEGALAATGGGGGGGGGATTPQEADAAVRAHNPPAEGTQPVKTSRGPLEALLPTSEEDYVEQPQPDWMAERMKITGAANPTYDQILAQSGPKPELQKMAGGLQGFLERFGRNLGDVGSEQPIGTRTNAAKAELVSDYNEKTKEYNFRRLFEMDRMAAKSKMDLDNFDYKKTLYEADVQKKNLWDAQMLANDPEYYNKNNGAFKAAAQRNGMSEKAYREMVATAPLDPTDPTGKRRIFVFTPEMRARTEEKRVKAEKITELTPFLGEDAATLTVLTGKSWMQSEAAQLKYERALGLYGADDKLTKDAKAKWEVFSNVSNEGILWDKRYADWKRDLPALIKSGRFGMETIRSMDVWWEMSYRQRKAFAGDLGLTPDATLEMKRRLEGKTETNKFYSGHPANRFELYKKANPNMSPAALNQKLEAPDADTKNQIYGVTRIEYKNYIEDLQNHYHIDMNDPTILEKFIDEVTLRQVLPQPVGDGKELALQAFYQDFIKKVSTAGPPSAH